MNIDPDMVVMMGKIMAVNAVVILLMALLSYAMSGLMLNGLAKVDQWLDPSHQARQAEDVVKS